MIGIDIGGANLKVVDKNGVHVIYCPLWRGASLAGLLGRFAGKENAAVVMSGELADCFSDKIEGINWITGEVKKVFPGAIFYGTDGRFHKTPVPTLASANWLACADYLQEKFSSSILVDMGSTTTDIIPLNSFPDLLGLSDLKRLKKGYLLYTGILRTPVAAISKKVHLFGQEIPLSSEFFAQSADVHLILGDIGVEEYNCDTPDGGDKSIQSSLKRVSRMVCADLSETGEDAARSIAVQIRDSQKDDILNAINLIREQSGLREIIAAGIGAPYICSISGATNFCDLIGRNSDALPAFAVKEVAERTESS